LIWAGVYLRFSCRKGPTAAAERGGPSAGGGKGGKKKRPQKYRMILRWPKNMGKRGGDDRAIVGLVREKDSS